MSVLNLAFLWALPLVGLPMLIHLLARRRRDVVAWGAMRFLLEAAPRRRRVWRLRDLLLLALRALAMALIAMILAQPMIRTAWAGGGAGRDVVIVVDASMSTQQRLGRETAYEAMRATVARVLGELREVDRVRILLASTTDRWLVGSPQRADRELRQLVDEQLIELAAEHGTADMLRAIRQGIDAEPAAEVNGRRVVIVVSDGQAHGWHADRPARWYWLSEDDALPDVRVALPTGFDQPRANLALEAISTPRHCLAAGQTARLTTTVRNAGSAASPATTLTWRRGEHVLARTAIGPLEPGQAVPAALDHTAGQPGVAKLTAELDHDDALALDNRASIVLEVVDRLPVLVVDGSPSAHPLHAAAGYLLAALGDAGQTGFEPTVIDAAALAGTRLADYQAVVLVDVPRLPEAAPAALRAYVAAGGGLLVALGERVDRDHFNGQLHAQGAGVAPLALAEPVGDVDEGGLEERVHGSGEEHPAVRLIADAQRSDLDRVQVYRRHRFAGGEGGEVTALLVTGDGEPVAVEGRVGRGRVILLGLPLDHSWSRLPLAQSFVVMVHEWLWYLSESGLTRWNLRPGEPIELPAARAGASALIEGPGGLRMTLTARGDVAGVDGGGGGGGGGDAFWFGHTTGPGRYVVQTQEEAGDPQVFHVQRFSAESDLTPLSPSQRETLARAGGLVFAADPLEGTLHDTGAARQPVHQPIWMALMLVLVGLMVAEAMLAAWVSRRRAASAGVPALG